MQTTERGRAGGFTLIEMIIAITILGVLAGIVAVFIAGPVRGFVDTARRAELTDVADLAIKRITLEVRQAVPNSIRIDASQRYLELLPARTGGRYCADNSEGCTPLKNGGTSFSVIGRPYSANALDAFVVVFNMRDDMQPDQSAYRGTNIRALDTANSTASLIVYAANGLKPGADPYRFQIVPSSGPVSFACLAPGTSSGSGTGELRRYTSYLTSIAGFNAGNGQPTSFSGTGALLADKVQNCSFAYDQANALVTIDLTITSDGESVRLVYQIHVDNLA